MDGWGIVSFEKLINSIEISKTINLEKFIFSLGIRYVGETLSLLISKEFVNLNNLLSVSNNKKRLIEIDGLGPKAVNSISDYFNNQNNKKLVIILNKI